MGIQERKEREKGERKTLILRCAKELLLEHGVDGVSMGDIAKKAELSKGTLYRYFPGKDDLFKEICDEAAIRFMKHFQGQARPGLSALETIKLFWRCYVDMFGESDDMIVIFTMKPPIAPAFPLTPFETNPHPQPPGTPDTPSVFYAMMRDMIRRGIQEGAFDPTVNPGMVARTMLSLFSYIVEQAAKMPKGEGKSRFIIEEMKRIFEILLRGIAREGFDRSALILPGLKE